MKIVGISAVRHIFCKGPQSEKTVLRFPQRRAGSDQSRSTNEKRVVREYELLKKLERSISIPLGVVVRRVPGATRWQKHAWKAAAVLPGAGQATWKELRRDGDAVEYHAATVPMELFRTDTEAYLQGLSDNPPCVYVVMREGEDANPLDIILVTASPYEAQDYADTGEELVEKVPMPDGLVAWIRDFVEAHHEDDVFVKRKRDKKRIDLKEDGIGDARIRQIADVYRAPSSRKEAS